MQGTAVFLRVVLVIEHVIFGIRSTDPATFLIACATLLAVALIASILPALRLVHLNPSDALRDE